MTVSTGDLASLLSTGERAVFHGASGTAVADLESAVALARAEGRPAEAIAASWLLGVALSATGRYGAALATLLPLLDDAEQNGATAERSLFGALAAATCASVHRALGRHATAAQLDTRGLALTGGRGEAAFDCLLGLSADAVGNEQRDHAEQWLQSAELLAEQHGDEWWRQLVRLDWGRCEVALLLGESDVALHHATAAVARAEASRAPRHVAKGLLFRAVAELQTGVDACGTLRRSAVLAESVGAAPVLWQAHALLGALTLDEDPAAAAEALAAARSVVLAVAADLPDQLRAEWLARPNVMAVFGG